MTFDSTPLEFARAAGAIGLDVTSGLVLAFPIFIMPALAKILQPAERLVCIHGGLTSNPLN